jgi:hypothetical protein
MATNAPPPPSRWNRFKSIFRRGPNPNKNLQTAILNYLSKPIGPNSDKALVNAVNAYIRSKGKPNWKKVYGPNIRPNNGTKPSNVQMGTNNTTSKPSNVPTGPAVVPPPVVPTNLTNGKVNGAKMNSLNKNVIKKNGRFYALGNGTATRSVNKYYVVNRQGSNSLNFKYSNSNKNAYNKNNNNTFTRVPKPNGNGAPSTGPKYTTLNSWLASVNNATKQNKIKLGNKYTQNRAQGLANFPNMSYQNYVQVKFPPGVPLPRNNSNEFVPAPNKTTLNVWLNSLPNKTNKTAVLAAFNAIPVNNLKNYNFTRNNVNARFLQAPQ